MVRPNPPYWSEHEKNLGALDKWLRDRDISKFDWKHSTDTPGRRRMIEYNRTPTEVALRDFIADIGQTAITLDMLVSKLSEYIEGDVFENPIEKKQVLKLLQHSSFKQMRLKFEGKAVRPWLIGDWENEDNDEIRRELKKYA